MDAAAFQHAARFRRCVAEQTHLKIYDCAIHEKGGRRWVSLPGRPMIDREGVALKDENGKTKYARDPRVRDARGGRRLLARRHRGRS